MGQDIQCQLFPSMSWSFRLKRINHAQHPEVIFGDVKIRFGRPSGRMAKISHEYLGLDFCTEYIFATQTRPHMKQTWIFKNIITITQPFCKTFLISQFHRQNTISAIFVCLLCFFFVLGVFSALYAHCFFFSVSFAYVRTHKRTRLPPTHLPVCASKKKTMRKNQLPMAACTAVKSHTDCLTVVHCPEQMTVRRPTTTSTTTTTGRSRRRAGRIRSSSRTHRTPRTERWAQKTTEPLSDRSRSVSDRSVPVWFDWRPIWSIGLRIGRRGGGVSIVSDKGRRNWIGRTVILCWTRWGN